MPFIKTTFKNIANNIAAGNYYLSKDDAIAQNKLAGNYKNNILVEPDAKANAEIASEAALAGVPNTIFSDWVKNNKDGITNAINNILNPGNSNSNTPNAAGNSTYQAGNTSTSNTPATGSGFDWSSLIPWAVAALIILGILKWKKVI